MRTTLEHDRTFGALADPTRRDIVRRAIDGEEGVAELAGHYPMSFAAVQKHVAVLEAVPSVEAMEQLDAMGMEEGLTQAIGQIDAILADDPVEA